MERPILMSKDKRGRRWDGKSRVSNDLYRRRFNEIFKKKKQILKTIESPMTHLRNLVAALILKLMRK